MQALASWSMLILEKFFDRVGHDILMGLVAKRVSDKRLLKLVRGFLSAGALVGPPPGGAAGWAVVALAVEPDAGVLDKEVERRGHRFVRYADDCNIYVRSWRASG